MASPPDFAAASSSYPALDGVARREVTTEVEVDAALVDSFLKEALQNPRHRLTVLRMELDIQKFMQNPEQLQFEFPHFSTSYLRLAAHRVAQHYGLHSLALDNGSRIVIQKTPDSKYPSICLSQIVFKQSESDKIEPLKIAIRPRLERMSSSDLSEIGMKRSPVRSVEERKEEYERARARIFNGSSNGVAEGSSSSVDGRKSPSSTEDESSYYRNIIDEIERTSFRDSGNTSRVAIFRDREKDRSDPDYDRSYDRYIRSLPISPNFSSSGPYTMLQPPYVSYEAGYCQVGQLPRTQTSANYGPNLTSPFASPGSSQTGGDSVYMNWPSPAMMYAQSYDHVKHAVFQVPFYQQPLSFDYTHNH